MYLTRKKKKMETVRLVKLLEVTEEDKWDFDPGYAEEMELAEGSYGIMDYYDDDDDTYRIENIYGDYWYDEAMFKFITPIEHPDYHIGDKMKVKQIKTMERDLPYSDGYAGVEGTVVNVYENNIIELKFEDGNWFYLSHWLEKPVVYQAY